MKESVKNNGEEDTLRCAQCGCELRYADNAIKVEEGIIGGKGSTFVPTSSYEMTLFCSEQHASEYLDGGEDTRPSFRRRIP